MARSDSSDGGGDVRRDRQHSKRRSDSSSSRNRKESSRKRRSRSRDSDLRRSKRRRSRDRSRDRRRRNIDRRPSTSSASDDDGGKKTRSNISGIEAAKRRMKEGLERASISKPTTDSTTTLAAPPTVSTTTEGAAEEAERHRRIGMIESDNFQPQRFRSSQHGKTIKEADDSAVSLTKHEEAIFGGANSSLAQEVAEQERQEKTIKQQRDKHPLAHENLFGDPAERERRWYQKWKIMRQRALSEMAQIAARE